MLLKCKVSLSINRIYIYNCLWILGFHTNSAWSVTTRQAQAQQARERFMCTALHTKVSRTLVTILLAFKWVCGRCSRVRRNCAFCRQVEGGHRPRSRSHYVFGQLERNKLSCLAGPLPARARGLVPTSSARENVSTMSTRLALLRIVLIGAFFLAF